MAPRKPQIDTEEYNELKTDVTLMKKDMSVISTHTEKLDQVIDQLKELVSGISKIIAIHEEKHAVQDQRNYAIERDLHDLDDQVREQTTVLHKRLNKSEEKILQKLDKMDENLEKKFKEQDGRIDLLEKWKWKVVGYVGGITAVGWVAFKVYPIIAPLL